MKNFNFFYNFSKKLNSFKKKNFIFKKSNFISECVNNNGPIYYCQDNDNNLFFKKFQNCLLTELFLDNKSESVAIKNNLSTVIFDFKKNYSYLIFKKDYSSFFKNKMGLAHLFGNVANKKIFKMKSMYMTYEYIKNFKIETFKLNFIDDDLDFRKLFKNHKPDKNILPPKYYHKSLANFSKSNSFNKKFFFYENNFFFNDIDDIGLNYFSHLSVKKVLEDNLSLTYFNTKNSAVIKNKTFFYKNDFKKELLEDNFMLINSWFDVIPANTFAIVRNLLHIKYILSVDTFLLNDCINFFYYYFNNNDDVDKFRGDDIEKNSINLVFKVRKTIHAIRIIFMHYFNLRNEIHHSLNKVFYSFKSFSTLNYIWFLEYNSLIFLIKIKLSNSFKFSSYLIEKNLIFNDKLTFISKWSYFTINSYLQLVVCEWSFFKLIFFINNLNKYLSYIILFFKKTKQLHEMHNQLTKKYFHLKFLFFKFIESDYKILTFILLPINNYKFYYNYILLIWFNYWNHKIVTWKYLS